MLQIPRSFPKILYPALFIEGWTWPDELCWIYEESRRHSLIVEIGSYRGKSAFAWLAGGTARVISIDPCLGHWSPAVAEEMLRTNLYGFRGRWDLIRLRSVEAGESLLQLLNGLKADLVFIDGDHFEESVGIDITFAKTIVRPGGIICGHAYDNPKCLASIRRPAVKLQVDRNFVDVRLPAGSIWYSPVSE